MLTEVGKLSRLSSYKNRYRQPILRGAGGARVASREPAGVRKKSQNRTCVPLVRLLRCREWKRD